MAAQQQTIRVSHPAAAPQTSDSSIGMSNMTTANQDAVRIVTTVARDQNALPLSGVSSTNSGQLNFTTQQLPHQQVRRVVITASNDNQQRVYQQQQQPQTHGLPVRYSNPGQPQQQYVVRYSQPQQQQQQPTVLVTPGSQQQQQSTVVIGGPPPLRRVDSRPLLLHQPSQQQLLRPPPNNYSQQQQQQQQQSRPVLLVNNQQQQQQQVRYGVAPNTQQQLQQNPQQNLRPGVTFVQPASQLHQPQQRPLQTIIQQQPLQQYPQVIYRQQQPQASYVQSNQQIQQPVYKQVIRPQQLQPQTIVQNPGAQSSEGGRQNASPLVNGVMGGENSKLQGTKSRSYSVNLSHPSGAPLTEEDRRRSLSLLGQTSIEEHHKAAVVQNEVLKRQSSGVFSFIKRKDQQQIPQSQNTARIMDQQQPQQRPEAAGGSSDSPQRQKVPTGINETIPTTSIPVEPKDNTKEDSKPITQESELTKKSLMNGKATVIKDDVQPPERPASRTSGVEEIKQPDVKGDSSVSVAQKSAQDLIQATGTAMLNLKQEKSGALIDGISTESKVDIIKGDSAKEIASKMVVPPEQPLAQGKATVDPVGTSVKQTIPVTEKQIIVNGEIRDDTSISVLSQEKSPSPIPELKQQINGHVEMEYESEGTGKTLSTEKVSPKSQSPRTESPIVQSSVSSSVPKSPVPAEKVTLMSVSPRTESPKPEDTLSPAPKSPIPPEKPLSTSGSSRTESPNPELVQSTISMSPASKSPVPPEKPLNTSVSPLAESPAKELTKSSTPSPAPKSPVPSKSPSPLPSRDVESVRTETPKPSEINVEKSSSTVSESSSPTVKIGGNATEIPQSTTANVPSQETDTSKNMIGTSSEPLPAETKVKIDSPSPEIPGRDIPSTADKAAISTSQEPGVRGPSPIEEKKQPKESVIQQEAVEPAKETSPSQVVSPLKTTSEIKNTNEVASSKEVVPREELLIKEEAAVSQEPVTKEPPPAISRKTPSPEQREITRSPAASNGHERPNSSKEIGKERDSPALIDESKLIIHEADIQRVPPQTSIDDLPEHEKTLLESLDTVCIEASGESKPTSKSPMFMNGHSLNLTKSPSPALSNKSPSPITKKSPSLSKAPSPEQKPVSPISPKSSTKPSPTEGMKSVESKSPKERGSPIVETVINKENESDQLESTVPEKDEKHEVAENGKLSSPEGDASDKLKMENGTPTVKQDKNETTESEDEKVVAKQKIISDDDSKPKKKVIKKRTKESADTKGDHDSGVDETTQGNEPSANGDVGGSPKKSPSKIPGAGGRRVMSPTKTPRSPIKAEPAPAPDKKKVPMNKIQVGAAPSPNLKTVRSKIGSLDNASYRPGGGHVKIEHRKLDFSKTQPKIAAKNDAYIPGGGDKKIQQVKLTWNAKPKVGSLDNATHKPGGGDKKIETVKLDFKDRAKAKIGSKDNVKHVPGGGTVKNAPSSLEGNSSDIENKKYEFNVQSKVGSLANVTHKPGGGDIKIFDDKDYLRQMSGGSLASSEGRASGAQSPIPASPSRELSEHSQGES